ncbi:hypothetical protein [Halomicrobium salinisoli]|uniref:hypothetical protein n=1 Tax=Halomicrobium salinisoli TaxID=2878391 RepID=UPI001CF003D0|nr:hypothetical protein [Halomicrobium salinisoli]
MSAPDESDGDLAGGRIAQTPPLRWVLVSGRRWVVVLLASITVYLTLLGFAALSPVPLRGLMGETPTGPLFQAMIIAVVTGVTLVVTIGQLVLSQELGTAGTKHEHMEEALSYQESVEELIDPDVSSMESADFLRELIAAAGDRAADVDRAASDVRDDALRDRIEEYAAALERDAAAVADAIDDARSSTFRVVLAALHFDYNEQLHAARRLRRSADGDLPGRIDGALDDLVETLSYVGSAREHVKTLYFQAELIRLARDVVYTGIPALLVSAGMVIYGAALPEFTGQPLGIDVIVWLVSAAVTVAVVPFLVLLAFILRIVTITQLTLAIGPIKLQETRQPDDG